jgi:hypothetical protein
MARLALPAFDGPHPQYNSLVTKSDGTTLGQVRKLEASDKFDTTKAGRVGSSTKKTLKKSKEATVSLDIWVDDDLEELAVALNAASKPATGQTLKLDPNSTPITLLIKNYNSEDLAATLLSTIYLYNYVATELKLSYDEDNEQVASISADAEDIYWVVA